MVHNGILFADQDKVHLIWHRNYREVFYMYSLDEGENWQCGEIIWDAPDFIDPICCAGMTQGDGHIWFSNCACKREEGRIHLFFTVRKTGNYT